MFDNKNLTPGFIIVNKPSGPTSHDIINKLRRITGIKKIGHAGTLDPFASGLLIVAIGREATKNINEFVKLDKEYSATLRLGATSDTYDRTGRKLEVKSKKVKKEMIEKVLEKFVGRQKQIPPMYSAKKVGGKKLYELARKGIEIKRELADVEIFDIKFINYKPPFLKIRVRCSSGTYIRSLAHDIGEKLGCGAYLEELERTGIGVFKIKNSVKPEIITENNWENFLFEVLS